MFQKLPRSSTPPGSWTRKVTQGRCIITKPTTITDDIPWYLMQNSWTSRMKKFLVLVFGSIEMKFHSHPTTQNSTVTQIITIKHHVSKHFEVLAIESWRQLPLVHRCGHRDGASNLRRERPGGSMKLSTSSNEISSKRIHTYFMTSFWSASLGIYRTLWYFMSPFALAKHPNPAKDASSLTAAWGHAAKWPLWWRHPRDLLG